MERDTSRDGPPSRRIRYALSAVALVTLASAAVGVRTAVTSPQRMHSGRAAVHRGAVDPAGMYVSADTLSAGGTTRLPDNGTGTRTRTLAAPALAPLSGASGPVATVSPDGQMLAYHTWQWKSDYDWFQPLEDQGVADGDPIGTPVVHVLNLVTSVDNALEVGSLSPAWRSDGALAYTHGPRNYRWNSPYLREVVVRTSPTSVTTWSATPDVYRVEGWANFRLIVSRSVAGGPDELDVFDGPGRSRVLADAGSLLAISPDGTEALVADPASDADPRLRLIRIADGSEAAVLPLTSVVDPTFATPVAFVAGPADWEGGHVVASTDTGLVVLSVAGDVLAVEQVLHLDQATAPNGMLYEPRFANADGSSIVAWEDVATPLGKPWSSAQLVCDRVQLTCTQSDAVSATHQPRPVYDRSAG
jgi:hypothetical protein